MTEQEWMDCDDPDSMLEFLEGKVSSRKLRLFACACCRRIWDSLPDENNRMAVEVAERFADGLVPDKERMAARNVPGVWAVVKSAAARDGHFSRTARECAQIAQILVGNRWGQKCRDLNAGIEAHYSGIAVEMSAQVILLRDIVGNPFHPIVLNVTWQTTAVLTLAQAAYNDRILPAGTLEPERLAVLADALEEAGCDNAGLLGHLRGPDPHVRGCSVVDLLTQRE